MYKIALFNLELFVFKFTDILFFKAITAYFHHSEYVAKSLCLAKIGLSGLEPPPLSLDC